MLKCWQHYPENRPNFAELQKELDVMLTNQQQEEYIEINAVDDPYCAMYPAQDDPDEEETGTGIPQVYYLIREEYNSLTSDIFLPISLIKCIRCPTSSMACNFANLHLYFICHLPTIYYYLCQQKLDTYLLQGDFVKQTLQQMQKEFQDHSKVASTPMSPPTDDTTELCNGSRELLPPSTSSANAYVETDI